MTLKIELRNDAETEKLSINQRKHEDSGTSIYKKRSLHSAKTNTCKLKTDDIFQKAGGCLVCLGVVFEQKITQKSHI